MRWRFLAWLMIAGAMGCGVMRGNSPSPVIVIEMLAETTDLRIDGKTYTAVDAMAWLRERSEQFGRGQPVLIKVDGEEVLEEIALLKKVAEQFYKNVYVAVPRKSGGYEVSPEPPEDIALMLR